MAFADYFDRGAVAAAQVIAGFNEQAFKQALSDTEIGVTLGPDAAATTEGRLLSDMTIRLLARLYPTLTLTAAPDAEALAADLAVLARRINPAIEITNAADAKLGIVIGNSDTPFTTPVFVGSSGWLAFVSSRGPQTLGDSENPFGPGAAACLGCANVFRLLFLGAEEQVDADVAYSTYTGDVSSRDASQPDLPSEIPADTVLIGCGAIGNGAAWALANAPLTGELHLVDRETIELSNLQRYVLADRDTVDAVKVDTVANTFTNGITAVPHNAAWAEFVADVGYSWKNALVALDSAADRRSVQASLPGRIVNAWTQPGDLGVSLHGPFGSTGACLSCLYLPAAEMKNEDQLVAEALGIPDHQQQVRHLLYAGDPAPSEMLDLVAERLSVPRESLGTFGNRPVRDLYVEGLCGGAVLPLDRLHSPQQEVHVPLAHQSALAGIQLAASFMRLLSTNTDDVTEITRINVLRPLGTDLCQPARRSDPRCICADADYVSRYAEKWRRPKTTSPRKRRPATRTGA